MTFATSFVSSLHNASGMIPVLAYIDPNAAGMLSQIITPLLIMAAAAVTFLRKQIGAAFSSVARLFRRREVSAE